MKLTLEVLSLRKKQKLAKIFRVHTKNSTTWFLFVLTKTVWTVLFHLILNQTYMVTIFFHLELNKKKPETSSKRKQRCVWYSSKFRSGCKIIYETFWFTELLVAEFRFHITCSKAIIFNLENLPSGPFKRLGPLAKIWRSRSIIPYNVQQWLQLSLDLFITSIFLTLRVIVK